MTTGAPEQALGPYLRAVRRHWLLVVAITLLTGAVAAATVLHSGPTYQAGASVLVSPIQQGDTNFVNTGVVVETGEPARTVQTAAALIDSLPAARATAAALGHGWTAAGVQSAVSVTALGQSDFLGITAQASTAGEAENLANVFAKEAVGYRAKIVQRNIGAQLSELTARLNQVSGTDVANVSLAQQLASQIATLRLAQTGGADPTLTVSALAGSGSRVGAPRWLIIILSLIGGFAIGSIAALAFDFFNRRISDLDEIEALFQVQVLATVPQVSSRRQQQGLLRPGSFPAIAFEQIRMLRVQLSSRERSPVIMLTSPGSGDGKTTLATALAAAFAETGEEVILMDLDLRKPGVARLLGLKQPRAASLSEGTLDELLIEVPDLPRVRVLPAPRGDVALFSMLLTRLPELLDEAETKARHVIIDAAPVGVVSESLEIAKICDQVVVAVRPGHTDRQRLVFASDLLTRAGVPVVGIIVVGQSTTKADDSYNYGYGYGYASADEAPANGATTLDATRHRRSHVESA